MESTNRNENGLITKEMLALAISGDKRATNSILLICQKTLLRFCWKEDEPMDDLITEVLLQISQENFKSLERYRARENEDAVKPKMLSAFLNNRLKRVVAEEGAKKWQVDRNVRDHYKQLARVSELEQIPLVEKNAWLLSQATGLPIVVICQTLRAKKYVPTFCSYELLKGKGLGNLYEEEV